MINLKNNKHKTIFVIISIPILFIAQYYLFKFGVLRPMVKGAEIKIVGGEYVKDIDKYVVKLNDTVTLSTGNYLKIPSYAQDANIWFNVLDDTGVLKIEGNKMTALKEGFSSIGIMKNSRVIKKAAIKVVDPKVQNLEMNIDGDLEYVGDKATIDSVVEVDYKKFQDTYKVSFESSDEDVLRVEGNKIKAVGVGTATLSANSGGKKIYSKFRINAWVSDIDINRNLEIEIGQTQNLNPEIKTSPRGLKHPNIRYEFLERKLPVARALSINEDGTMVGLREGKETIKIICGNKSKLVKVNVVEDSITNNKVQNLEYTYDIVDNKLIVTLKWDYLNGVYDYDVYMKNNLINRNKFSKIKSVTIDKDDIDKSRKIKTTIEIDLDGNKSANIDIYVVGKTKVGTTKPSNVVNIKIGDSNPGYIDDMKVEGLTANIDLENNIVNIVWDDIEKYNCTYNIYVRNNSKGESNFSLYRQGIQGNECTIGIPEGELNLDVYVVAIYNGSSSQNSNIINIR